MEIRSSAFANGEKIPRVYTCEGRDVSPPLTFADVPGGCQSLALVVDDPDSPDPRAPRRIWTHWLIYNLPPHVHDLPEGAAAALPGETRVGTNDSASMGWSGPCPPIGRHRYIFRLYALDVVLPDLGPCRKPVLEKAMQGHVLAEAELVGTYQKGD
jgi:Raf kinase inhibitor-like YbhB/YbcL family protein